ncbi:MAG: hypothetical protein MUC89_01480 [Acetobacteraceae bacterium]|nr:hypothetical protein [Acetobacteraceae bacterium]
MPLTPEIRERLAKIAGRLGSDHEGERAAAGLMATRLLRAHNLTWSDALLAAQPAPPPPPPPPPKPARRWNDAAHGAALAAQCLAWPEVLTEWERGFCRSVAARRSLTARQQAVLARIARKARDFAWARGAA